MNITQAKEVSIMDYLRENSIQPNKEFEARGDAWFLSPLRTERTPSFKVDTIKNRWYDFGEGKGGSIIDLVMLMNGVSCSGAIDILSSKEHLVIPETKPVERFIPDSRIRIRKVGKITSPALLDYLQDRRIDLKYAGKYIKQADYSTMMGRYYAIAFLNEFGGYELRNPYWKGSSSPKAPTTIYGDNHDGMVVFEGFFDFLSYLTFIKKRVPPYNVTVMNSLSFLERISARLSMYDFVDLYLDNDQAGQKAKDILVNMYDHITDQSSVLFPSCKDYNDFLLHQK